MRQEDDKFARESFTFRRMKRWQIWALLAAVVIMLLIAYALL